MPILSRVTQVPSDDIVNSVFDIFTTHCRNREVIILTTELTNDFKSHNNVNMALSLQNSDYKVKIITSYCDREYWKYEVPKLDIELINTRLPRNFFGYFRDTIEIYKSFVLSMWTVFTYIWGNKKNVLCDCSKIAIPILQITRCFRLTYFQYFDTNYEPSNYNILEKYALRLTDQNVVQNRATKLLFERTFTECSTPRTLYPCIDTGKISRVDNIEIKEVNPYLSKNTFIFLTFGNFEQNSDFELTIDAFNLLHDRISERYSVDKIRLIIARNSEIFDENELNYYNNLREYAIETVCRQRIFFFKTLTAVQKKTLLTFSTALIYTKMIDYLGTDIIEAMYVGVPVIAVENILSMEYISPNTGWLVPRCDDDLVDIMDLLVTDNILRKQRYKITKQYFKDRFSFQTYSRKVRALIAG